MMPPCSAPILLADAEATDRLGAALGRVLAPGDTVLLEGPLGAGKSALARAAIHARVGAETEVPSPTFTLVQVYDAGNAELWHADLYRLGDPDEVAELGLDAAFAGAICLVEWPERLGPWRPARCLTLRLAMVPAREGRTLRAIAEGEGWDAALAALERSR